MSPGGNIRRRVRAGETFHFPARVYNEMLDAADAARAVATIPSQIAATEDASKEIRIAYNASDYGNAPRGAIVELCARTHTIAQIEFVRPGEAAGLGVYGILLEPIPEGRMGKMAFAGGAWKLLAEGAAVGDRFGAVDGSWIAVADASGPLVVVRESIGGVAEGFFSRAGTDVFYHEIAAHKHLISPDHPGFNHWLDYQYFVGGFPDIQAEFEVYKLANPLDLSIGFEALFATTDGLRGYLSSWGNYSGAVVRLKTLLEDFDLEALTYETFGAISQTSTNVVTLWNHDGSFQEIGWRYASLPVSGTAYGFAFCGDVTQEGYVFCDTAGPQFRQAPAQGDNW